jgi:hypothetical protein
VGAGADSPPAGKLTVIAQSYPGLRAILNPVAVGGGADAEPAGQIRKYAPRSVLCFDRAVSVFDFEALAARAPGVSRARALWAWNNARQRTTVTVYVGDDAAAATAARAALSAAGDPNRPVTVIQAAEAGLTLTLTLIIRAGWDADLITGGVAAALTDPDRGLFCAEVQGIGRPVFDSQIEAAILAVPGAVAITALQLTVGGADDAGPLHDPGAGGYFVLDPSDITLVTEADTHGG